LKTISSAFQLISYDLFFTTNIASTKKKWQLNMRKSLSYFDLKWLTANQAHNFFLLLPCILFLLTSCQTDESHPISRFEHENNFGIQNPSPAIDPSELSFDERKLFATLSPSGQRLFSSLTAQQRAWAINLTHPEPPEKAIWKAASQEILELSIPAQNLYSQLNEHNKFIFLILDDAPTKAAIEYAERMSPNNAVQEGLKLEIDSYPNNFKKIINKLTPNEQLLFLTLSESTQTHVFELLKHNNTSQSLEKAKETDIQRLPKDEQVFIKQLSPSYQTLFLILPPEGRWMTMSLTKKLDFNLAMQYAASIQTADNPNNNR